MQEGNHIFWIFNEVIYSIWNYNFFTEAQSGNCHDRWTQSLPFFPKSGHFFNFQKKQGRPHLPSPLVASLHHKLSMTILWWAKS